MFIILKNANTAVSSYGYRTASVITASQIVVQKPGAESHLYKGVSTFQERGSSLLKFRTEFQTPLFSLLVSCSGPNRFCLFVFIVVFDVLLHNGGRGPACFAYSVPRAFIILIIT